MSDIMAGDICRVEWLDADDPTDAVWVEGCELAAMPDMEPCISVGIVVCASPLSVMLACSSAPLVRTMYSGVIRIPRCAILKMERLEVQQDG